MEDVPSEHWEQAQVVAYCDNLYVQRKYPELALLFSVPNGGYELAGDPQRRAAAVAKLRAEGLRVGFPDLILPVARRGYGLLAIEMKSTRKGAAPTPEQAAWGDRLRAAGHRAVVCYGHKEAIKEIETYLTEDK